MSNTVMGYRTPMHKLAALAVTTTSMFGLALDANASGGGPPTNKASYVEFTDTDLNKGIIGGTVTIGKAADETDVTAYVLRWGLLGHCSAANSYIGEVPATGSDVTFELPAGTDIPGAVYELLVYTKNASGEMPTCQSTYTSINDVAAPKPDQIANAVTMTKSAGNLISDIASISLNVEGIDIKPAADETNITDYAIYWADSWGTKSLIHNSPIAVIPATGDDVTYRFPDGATTPWPVWGIVVCSRNYNQEYCGPLGQDNRATYPAMYGMDFAKIIGETLPTIDDLVVGLLGGGDCPGADIVTSCGNLVCETGETDANCPSDCTEYGLASYNHQTICADTTLSTVLHPASVEEIQQIVVDAVANGQHVKAVSGQLPLDNNVYRDNIVGTASDFVCTDGVTIGMDQVTPDNPNFDIYIEEFEGKEVVHAPAGMRLFDLGEWLYERGRGIGNVHMGWAKPTIGGNISTSAHGSSPKNGAVLAHRVVALDVIGADGVMRTYSEGTTDEDTFKALRTGLGYLGVIVNAKIEIEEASNMHVKVTYHDVDELFNEEDPNSFYNGIAGCDFGQYNWYPDQGAYVRTCGVRTDEPVEPGARNRLLAPNIPDLLNAPMQQMMQAGACDLNNGVMEFVEMFRFLQLALQPPLEKEVNGVAVPSGDVIGPEYKMQSSDLLTGTEGFFQMDWEIAVPMTHMQEASEYIRDFLAGQNAKNRAISLPLVGVFTRFALAEDKTLMAYTGTGGDWVDGEPVVYFEMPIYLPVGFSEEKFADYMAPYIEYSTYLIENFQGRGHWAKNREWIFPLEQETGNLNFDNRFDRFNAVVDQLDPNGVFANAAGERLGITYPNFTYPANWNN